jgi:adenine-specific DNA-methyltransferase
MVAVEPACGRGAFLVPMVERLSDACKREGLSLLEAAGALEAYDLQAEHVATSRNEVLETLVARGWPIRQASAFSEKAIRQGDFLLQADAHPRADFVVGNPPYIRLESVPLKRSESYRRNCGTMSGRADIYVGFFEMGLKALKQDGVLSFICADRWMRNQYGRLLRMMVAEQFSMDAVIEMHAVDAFDTEVSAYPSIAAIRRGKQGPVLAAEAKSTFGPDDATQLLRWSASRDGTMELRGSSFRAAILPGWFSGPGSWPSGSPSRLTALKQLENSFPTLEDDETGTKVGIGIATGADEVFVTTDPAVVEADRLLPLAMAYDTMEGQMNWSRHYLVNPWRSDGEGLVNLTEYPRMRAYYQSHDLKLSSRSVAKRRPQSWYRTIDRVNPSLSGQEKLLFPDIKAVIHPVLDKGQTYPHHNLYFVVSRSWDLEILGGILLSRVAQLFIEAYAVRMRGNYLRFQAQYLRRIRVPHISDISARDAGTLSRAFNARDIASATRVAERLYGVKLSALE